MTLTCHTFLNVYIQAATFGRKFSSLAELCGGDKEKDSNGGPDSDCVDEEVALKKTRFICHGRHACAAPILPNLAPLGPACDTLKREYNVNYTCGMIGYYIINDINTPS